ncbi:MAG TPA: hypothetical protein VFS43_09870 [Polyangiaceae bacterium]|nr:hypothetical protein [Polyangiaceae bacterium]
MKKLALLVLVLAASGSSFVSCSLVVEPTARQCSNDADCAAMGPQFEGTFCNERFVCQNSESYCRNNQDCLTRTQRDNVVCRLSDNTCVDLLTAECPKLLADQGDLAKDPVVFAHLGLTSVAAPFVAAERALDMARQEWARTTQGVPGASPPRPVVTIACDIDYVSSEQYKRAIDHVVDNVQVPLIFGPYPNSWGAYLLPKAIATGTVFISAGFETVLENVDRKYILFRHGFGPKNDARAASLLFEQIYGPKIRAERGLPPDAPLKLALVYNGSGFGRTIAEQDAAELTLNGKPALQNSSEHFRQISYGDPAAPDFQATFGEALVALGQFKPDFFVTAGGGKELADIVTEYEKANPGITHYVASAAVEEQVFLETIDTSTTAMRERFFILVTQPSNSDPNFAKFTNSFRGIYKDTPEAADVMAAGAANYDEYYLAMYALAGNLGRPVTGRNLGEIILNRLSGRGASVAEVGMGPGSILGGVQRLSVGDSILYRGALGPSSFDEEGDTSPPIQVLCVSGDRTLSNRYIETGISYDTAAQKLQGSNSCF